MESVSGISIIHQHEESLMNDTNLNEIRQMSDNNIEEEDSFAHKYHIKAYNPQNQQLDIEEI